MSAELGLALIARILHDGPMAMAMLNGRGFDADDLVGEAQVAWKAIDAHVKRYHALPNADMLRIKSGVVTPAPNMGIPLTFLVDEVLSAALYRHMCSGLDATLKTAATDRNGMNLFASTDALVTKYRRKSLAGELVSDLPALADAAENYYDMLKSGKRGILSPWDGVNNATLGWWPEDLILFAARSSVGKTWMLILLGLCAWEQGKKVLFASTEMSRVRIAMRFFALKYKLTYDPFRRGQSAAEQETIFRDGLADLRRSKGFCVVGGDFDYSPEALEAAIYAEEPDLVIGDGAYLFKAPGKDRTEKAANAFDALKRVGKRTQRPVLISSQLNRDAVKGGQGASGNSNQEKGKGIKMENIALTDAAGWNTDVVYGMFQSPDMKADKRMTLKTIKLREGSGDDVDLWWDFEAMNFAEIPPGTPSAPKDFDTGVDADAFEPNANVPFLWKRSLRPRSPCW